MYLFTVPAIKNGPATYIKYINSLNCKQTSQVVLARNGYPTLEKTLIPDVRLINKIYYGKNLEKKVMQLIVKNFGAVRGATPDLPSKSNCKI